MHRAANNTVSKSFLPYLNHFLTTAATGTGLSDHPSWGKLIWSYSGRGLFDNNPRRTIWGGGSIGLNGTGNINA